MIDKDNIQDLLREKLQSHEVTPSDAVWKNVSSSLSSAATSGAAAGSSILFKAAVAVIGVSGLGIATYFVLQEEEIVQPKTPSSIQLDNNQEKDSETNSLDVVKIEIIEDLKEDKKEVVSKPTDIVSSIVNPNEKETVIEDVDLAENKIESTTEPQSSPEQTNPAPLAANTPVEPESTPPIVEEATVILEDVVEVQEEVFEEIVEEENEESIILPNIFTPNNDGSNDFFTIEMNEKLDFQIVVIDQTNTVVFQSNDRNFRWDGTMMSGEPAPSGNYVYFLSAKTMGGKDFVKSSKLRIQR